MNNVTNVSTSTLNTYFKKYPEKLTIKKDILNVFSDLVYLNFILK
jgi:hypothetical protein